VAVTLARTPEAATDLQVTLCGVHRSAIFQPGDAGRREAAGDALQADGPVQNHGALGGPGGADGRRNCGDGEENVITLLLHFTANLQIKNADH